MRYLIALFVLLAALFGGCADSIDTDTGPETDVDTDTDADTDADFEATAVADTFPEMSSPALTVPGASCSGIECVVTEPGSFVGTLTAPGWLAMPQSSEVFQDGEKITLPFTDKGQAALEVKDGIYIDEKGGEHDVVMDTNEDIIYIAIGACTATPTGTVFDDDMYGCLSGEILSGSSAHYIATGTTTVEHTITFLREF